MASAAPWEWPGYGPAERAKLVHCVPDAVIVAEPTQLNVVVAHKGVVRWRCQTRGLAVYSAEPQRGENAIYHMAHVLLVLEAYARSLAARRERHPLLGASSLSVGLISGGLSVNTVPDACTIDIIGDCFRTSIRRKPWNTSLICSINAVPACRWFTIRPI